MTISLKKCFQHKALLQKENLTVTVIETLIDTNFLHSRKHLIKSLFVNESQEHNPFILCATEKEIVVSTLDKDEEKKENKLWTEFINPDKRLGCVEVVSTGTRDFFYATEDNNSYLNHLKV